MSFQTVHDRNQNGASQTQDPETFVKSHSELANQLDVGSRLISMAAISTIMKTLLTYTSEYPRTPTSDIATNIVAAMRVGAGVLRSAFNGTGFNSGAAGQFDATSSLAAASEIDKIKLT